MFKREKDLCQYKDINECPYNNRHECPQIKDNCYLPNDMEGDDSRLSKKNIIPVLLIIISILLLFIVEFIGPKCDKYEGWFKILGSISVSLLAGVLLSIMVDIPKKFNDYSKLISTSLTSYAYLRGLNKEELSVLRSKVTAELYSRNMPKMPRGLIKLDNKICDLLKDPYYLVYRETIDCDKLKDYKSITGEDPNESFADMNFLKKNSDHVYTLKNPFYGVRNIEANIGLDNYVYLPEDCSFEKLFRINKFQISIDNGAFYDISSMIKIVYNTRKTTDDNLPKTTSYNTGFHIITRDGVTIHKEQLKENPDNDTILYENMKDNISNFQLLVSFEDNVRVRFNYSLIVPETDNHYTKRLKYTTKSYRLDYSTADEQQRLIGQLFGTLIDHSQVDINESADSRHISIEAFEWLLPKSGAYVVHTKK